MGWNEGFKILETQIIGIYNLGILTPQILDALVKPFRGTDCDTSGLRGLVAKDGLNLEAIVVKTIYPVEFQDAIENPKWFQTEEPGMPLHHKYNSNEKILDLFENVLTSIWKMW